ncbi:MAG TPA: hypothetical protein VGG75_05660 [Trebonia sp.]
MNVIQKWLGGLIGLGALYLVGTQGKGIATTLQGAQKFISGTEYTAITGKS